MTHNFPHRHCLACTSTAWLPLGSARVTVSLADQIWNGALQTTHWTKTPKSSLGHTWTSSRFIPRPALRCPSPRAEFSGAAQQDAILSSHSPAPPRANKAHHGDRKPSKHILLFGQSPWSAQLQFNSWIFFLCIFCDKDHALQMIVSSRSSVSKKDLSKSSGNIQSRQVFL